MPHHMLEGLHNKISSSLVTKSEIRLRWQISHLSYVKEIRFIKLFLEMFCQVFVWVGQWWWEARLGTPRKQYTILGGGTGKSCCRLPKGIDFHLSLSIFYRFLWIFMDFLCILRGEFSVIFYRFLLYMGYRCNITKN